MIDQRSTINICLFVTICDNLTNSGDTIRGSASIPEAGNVTICHEVINTGSLALPVHDLWLTGELAMEGSVHTLAAGETYTFSREAYVADDNGAQVTVPASVSVQVMNSADSSASPPLFGLFRD